MDPDETRIRRNALLAACLASFLTPFMGSAVPIAVPAIRRDLGADAVVVGWVVTAFLAASTMFLLPFGRLADIVGRRRIFVAGLASYGATSALCGLAPDLAWLVGARVLQGIAAAMIFGTGIAILTSVYPPAERGRVLGINVAMVYVGLALGPPVGGFLTEHAGWRAVFLANAAVSLPAFWFAGFRLRGEWAGARGERFDLPGAAVLAVAFGALTYGLAALGTSPVAPWAAGAGALGLVAFVILELRTAQPIVDVRLVAGNRILAFSSLAALVNYGATSASGYLLSLHLQDALGLTARGAGLVLLAQPAAMALLSPAAGRLSDRIEPRLVATAGMVVCCVSLGLFAAPAVRDSVPLVVGNLVLLGAGFALFSAPNTNAIMGSVAPSFYGVTSSIVGTMRLAGGSVSMAVVSILFGHYLGALPRGPVPAAGLREAGTTAFALFAGLCLLGSLASAVRGRRGPGPGTRGSGPGAPLPDPGSRKPSPV
jgi:EmrB/QacA subfamily drug resistance transporter